MTTTNKSHAGTPKSSVHEPPLYGPAAGEKALKALAPLLTAMAPSDVAVIRVDVEAATYAALGVAGFLADPKARARFTRLPKEEMDMTAVDGLETACFATLYALAEARAAGALETEAKMPSDVVAEAVEIEGRMQALCEYHFAEDPDIKAELARLRPGSGHRDLANDLLGYARIYELRAAAVKADQKHYRPGDAARAKELAGSIIQVLSSASAPRARAAYDLYARAWTRLMQCYEEVRAAGLWLFRNDPMREERFPSLFAAARPNGGRPKKQAPAPAASAGEGATSAAAPAAG